MSADQAVPRQDRQRIKLIPALEISEDEMAMIRQRRKNRDLYREQASDIVKKHPSRDVAIVGHGEIHSFERHTELRRFLDQLDRLTRLSVFIMPRAREALSTGYLVTHR